MANQLTIKAEVTIQYLADGGYIVNGVALGPGPTMPDGSAPPQPIDRMMKAREAIGDAIEDSKTFLAKHNSFAIVS